MNTKIKTYWNNLRGMYFRPKSYIALIINCKCAHTMFFKKNIDIAFVDKNMKVLRVYKNVRPWNILNIKDSYYIIEKFSDNNCPFYKEGEYIKI